MLRLRAARLLRSAEEAGGRPWEREGGVQRSEGEEEVTAEAQLITEESIRVIQSRTLEGSRIG